MAYKVVSTREFDDRLDKAVAYRVDNYGKRSAGRLLEQLEGIANLLSTTPRMGSLVEETDPTRMDALRWVRIGSYIAIYRVHDEPRTVVLLMLFSASSNWRRIVSRL